MNTNDADADNKDQSLLKRRHSEYIELEAGLKNELINKESLLFLITRTRSQNLSKTGPIKDLSRKIEDLRQKLLRIEKKYLMTIDSITELDNQIIEEEKDYQSFSFNKNALIYQKSALYQEKIRLKLIVDQEKEKALLAKKQQHDKKKLKKLEQKLKNYKNIELLQEEILSIETFCATEEEKFKLIQRVTNVKSVGDIISHYSYLVDNKTRMYISVSSSISQIDKLNLERIRLSEELLDLKFHMDEPKGLESTDLVKIQEKFREKTKYIENYEARLEKMQEIIISAINTFSRVGDILRIKLGKIRNENLMKSIQTCFSCLSSMVEEIHSKQSASSKNKSLDLSYSEHIPNKILNF